MRSDWRLLQDDIHEARHHFAAEEAIARLLDEGHSPPTLRLRRVYPSVFIGVHQDAYSEVDVDYCLANNIQIVRRMNGGGAVYQEMGSFCFSAFFRLDTFGVDQNELYRVFAEPVIRTCADYGVHAHFGGRNDVLVGNRKIYGSAQFSCYQAFVQSGTFLVNMNFDAMARCLTPPALKFAGKPVRSIQERVTSLSREVGREIDTQEVMDHFACHFSKAMQVQLKPEDLTVKERELTEKLFKVKYGTERWNFGSQMEFQITVAEKTEEGVISISADVEGNVLQKISIHGDILFHQRQSLDDLANLLSGNSIIGAAAVLQEYELPIGIRESLLRLLEKLDKEISDLTIKRSQER